MIPVKTYIKMGVPKLRNPAKNVDTQLAILQINKDTKIGQ